MSDSGDIDVPGASRSERRRRRSRHKKRRRPRIVVHTWHWWHLLAAIGVALFAGVISILILRGYDAFSR